MSILIMVILVLIMIFLFLVVPLLNGVPTQNYFYTYDDTTIQIICPKKTNIRQTTYKSIKTNYYGIEIQCESVPVVKINKPKPKDSIDWIFEEKN